MKKKKIYYELCHLLENHAGMWELNDGSGYQQVCAGTFKDATKELQKMLDENKVSGSILKRNHLYY